MDMQLPRNVWELQKFTGRVVALSRFISRSANCNMPFFGMLRAPKLFKWSEEQQVAFDDLKKYLVNLTTLKPPTPKAPLFLYLAATPRAVSAVLVYEIVEEGKLKQFQVYYVSETLHSSVQLSLWKR